MRTVAFFFAAVVFLGLLTGCTQRSEKNEAATWSLFSGVNYPEIPEDRVVQLNKSDFPTGKISSIEQIPLDLIIENRELGMYIKDNYLLIKHLEMREKGLIFSMWCLCPIIR